MGLTITWLMLCAAWYYVGFRWGYKKGVKDSGDNIKLN